MYVCMDGRVLPLTHQVSLCGRLARMQHIDVIGIDPGVHTGLAHLRLAVSGSSIGKPSWGDVQTTQVVFPKDFSQDAQAMRCFTKSSEVCNWVVDRVGRRDKEPLIIGYELWRHRPDVPHSSKPEGFSAMWVQAITQMDLIATWAVPPKFLNYTAGTCKSSVTDARLKQRGLWAGRSPHERDACRVLTLAVKRVLSG